MEYFAAQEIRKLWGKKPCDHPRLERAHYAGAFLISYFCVQCGAEFTIAQKMEMDIERKKEKVKSRSEMM